MYFINGSEHITALINEAVTNGKRTATVTGNYEIDTAIRIPSDFTLVLNGCHLKMADGVYSNMFVNKDRGIYAVHVGDYPSLRHPPRNTRRSI